MKKNDLRLRAEEQFRLRREPPASHSEQLPAEALALGFLQKPFDIETLSAEVRKMLAQGSS